MIKFKKLKSKIKSISPTVYAVILFIVLLTVTLIHSKSAQAEGLYIGLGKTFINSNQTTHELGYRFKKYGFSIERTGEGRARKTSQGARNIYSAYRVIDPKWEVLGADFKPVIGLAYTPDQALVGNTNFRLEIYLTYFDTLEVFLKHYSSAGLYENNTGIDSIGIRLALD